MVSLFQSYDYISGNMTGPSFRSYFGIVSTPRTSYMNVYVHELLLARLNIEEISFFPPRCVQGYFFFEVLFTLVKFFNL